ncbi:transposase [Streptomyces sp. URMC 126]|uniref:transposase n=1 Tax=Streptomyces sp. URMC 126 TaxID=3423401 RepID=UPI003F198CCA
MTREPYAGCEPYARAERMFWITDNGSSHRAQKVTARSAAMFPNAVMVHTPVHASWLNQVEIYFSVVRRKAVTPNSFTDLAQVRDRLRNSRATTAPRHSHSSGSPPPPTRTICRPGSTGTPPITQNNPPSR